MFDFLFGVWSVVGGVLMLVLCFGTSGKSGYLIIDNSFSISN